MSIWKPTTRLVVLVALLGGAGRRGAAQGGNIPIEETTPLTISGFAVGLGSYDRNLAQSAALGSKIALSVFRPWSDQLYLFAQLTTHLEDADNGDRDRQLDHQLDTQAPLDADALVRALRCTDRVRARRRAAESHPHDVVHVRERAASEVHGFDGAVHPESQDQHPRPR